MNTTFKIDWGEVKTGQYGTTFKGTFIRPDGSKFDATISQKDKKGVDFPNFVQLAPGREVVGVEWKSEKGNTYIFAPKEVSSASGGNFSGSKGGSAAINKAMDKKIEAIGNFQDDKNTAIKLSQAMRDAVQLAIEELSGTTDKTAMASRIIHWRNWILQNWGDVSDTKSPF